MIHEIGIELQTKLRSAGCPLSVVDGPEPTKTATWGRERIVIERAGGDKFGHAISQAKNPKHRMTQQTGAKLTIYAQSVRAGALHFEHERRAQHVLDLVLVALSEIQSLRKGRDAFIPDSGDFITPPDLEASERRGGAVYELRFTVPRAIAVQTWAGDARPQVALRFVRMTGSPDLTFAEVGGTGDTITRSDGSWLDDGFLVGDLIRVVGSASNDVTGEIAELTATVLTLTTTDLTPEGPVGGCSVTSVGGISSCTHVSAPGGAASETACGDC